MVFSSPIFLSLFLPLTLALYFLTDVRFRNNILLAASLLFYSWGEPYALLAMIVIILVNYVGALLISQPSSYPLKYKLNRKTLLVVVLSADLFLLFIYKYLNFTIANINELLEIFRLQPIIVPVIGLPIGISFYSFQAISYIIDVYRGDAQPQKNLSSLVLYISLFPLLLAGPIVRYNTIHENLYKRFYIPENLYIGLRRFVFGLAKKILIADSMGIIADNVFVANPEQIPTLFSWIGVIAYSLQIYYDFSGYSDMAIGLGKIFNFHFLENFRFPYSAISIKDFWRRWHISLSAWLLDYLYIPLGGNRVSTLRTYANIFIVFLFCGLWHGAAWNFVAWGAWHGAGLILEQTRFFRFLSRLPTVLGNAYVLLFVIVGWLLFRAPDISYAITYLKIMFTGNDKFDITSFISAWDFMTISNGIFMLLGIIFAYPAVSIIFEKIQHRWIGVIVSIALTITYLFAMTSTISPFIYFRF